MRVGIEREELWPDYVLCAPEDVVFPEDVVDVPEETVERWRAAAEAYGQVQDEMGAAFAAARGEVDV